MWKIVVLIPIALLALAPLDWPYGYYTFLRLVVTGACIWFATLIYEGKLTAPVVILGLTAILYNPLAKISMTKDAHTFVNIGTILLLAVLGWHYRERLR